MKARSASHEIIHYATTATALGPVAVAMSEAGVVWVDMTANADEAHDVIARRFPDAELRPAERRHAAWIDAVAEHVDEPRRAAPLPLDIRGTEFQSAVWLALLDIPVGETRSYAEVARAIGRPTAVRAVAQACGANPIGIVVPCHRVIGSDGSLTGYAGGIERKRALLEREGVEIA